MRNIHPVTSPGQMGAAKPIRHAGTGWLREAQARGCLPPKQLRKGSLVNAVGMLQSLVNTAEMLQSLVNVAGMLLSLVNAVGMLSSLVNSVGMLQSLVNVAGILWSLLNVAGMLRSLPHLPFLAKVIGGAQGHAQHQVQGKAAWTQDEIALRASHA